uniref:Uncharacterized protein n=1 Tax=Homalodisca liturata TaxID=320908 RepID=A0A1B6I8N6_9HEMI
MFLYVALMMSCAAHSCYSGTPFIRGFPVIIITWLATSFAESSDITANFDGGMGKFNVIHAQSHVDVRRNEELIDDDGMQRLRRFVERATAEMNANKGYDQTENLSLPSAEQYLGRLARLVNHLELVLKRQYDEQTLESVYDRLLMIEKRATDLGLQQNQDYYRDILLRKIDVLKKKISRKLYILTEYNTFHFITWEDQLFTVVENGQNSTMIPFQSGNHIGQSSSVEKLKTLLKKFEEVENVLMGGKIPYSDKITFLDHLNVS